MLKKIVKYCINKLPPKIKLKLGGLFVSDLIRINNDPRFSISTKYIKGTGIEIGALYKPIPVNAGIQVTYVDRMNTTDLRKQYPELHHRSLIEPDVIDDGEKLTSITNGSQDFVIAAHMIEHTQDPIGALKNWLRVLKPGGIVYLAVPNKNMTFDIDRPVTSFDHILKDYLEGPEWSKRMHFEEWVSQVLKLTGKKISEETDRLIGIDYSIHYHVWDEFAFLDFLISASRLTDLSFSIQHYHLNYDELIFILKKSIV